MNTEKLSGGKSFPYEVNSLGIQIPTLLEGLKSKTKSNVVYLSVSNPLFIEIKNIFRESIKDKFASLGQNVLEDYLTGFTYGFIKTQYKKYNTSEYPMVIGLLYKANNPEIVILGSQDGKKSQGNEASADSADSPDYDSNCSDCCGYFCYVFEDSCDECCDIVCGYTDVSSDCEGGKCA